MSCADQAKLLQFVTSTQVLPVGGFEALEKKPGEETCETCCVRSAL